MKNESARRVLVAEDERPMARALQAKLTKAGFDVSVTFNGREALEALEKETFDIALLDLIMPEMDGFSVLEELKKRNNATPVIVTSNLSQEEDEARVRKLGAKDYFVKSNTSINEIVQRVKTYLDGA